MATHSPLLSYHFDTSKQIFQKVQDVGFQKMYSRNCHPEWYRQPNFQGQAHGLVVSTRRLASMYTDQSRVQRTNYS